MKQGLQLDVIAHMRTHFPSKFGLPRQSGLASGLPGTVVFAPAYRNADALRGIEEFSHMWLIWEFSQAVQAEWHATVRPPRLGGNQRVGVFATRSPYRPNPLGLSSVRLDSVELDTSLGPVLHVSGIDMVDGTPIYDIKPYILLDSHPDARESFAGPAKSHLLQVVFPENLLSAVPEALRPGLTQALALDPRPAYQTDPARVYGFPFAGLEIGFTVDGNVLTVRRVTVNLNQPAQ